METANRLFYQRGYEHTSFSDIVEASGMSRGNITYYFESKSDLLHAVIDFRLQSIRDLLTRWEREFDGPRERLKRFARMIASSGKEITRYGCPMGSLNTELGKRDAAMQKEARPMFDQFRDWLTAQFQALGNSKGRARDLAMQLLVRGQGISVMAHVYHDEAFLKREVSRLEKWIDLGDPGS